MIITRSPLRITLGGGGTDLPSYYRDHEGFLIAAAIDKYVFVTVISLLHRASFLSIPKSNMSIQLIRSITESSKNRSANSTSVSHKLRSLPLPISRRAPGLVRL